MAVRGLCDDAHGRGIAGLAGQVNIKNYFCLYMFALRHARNVGRSGPATRPRCCRCRNRTPKAGSRPCRCPATGRVGPANRRTAGRNQKAREGGAIRSQGAAAAWKAAAEEQRRIAGKLRGCADAQVLNIVQDAVAASPNGFASGLRVTDFGNSRETGLGGSTPKRSCFPEMR